MVRDSCCWLAEKLRRRAVDYGTVESTLWRARLGSFLRTRRPLLSLLIWTMARVGLALLVFVGLCLCVGWHRNSTLWRHYPGLSLSCPSRRS